MTWPGNFGPIIQDPSTQTSQMSDYIKIMNFKKFKNTGLQTIL